MVTSVVSSLPADVTGDWVRGLANSRTILVTFLGAIVRPAGDWMPISAAVGLVGGLGVDESSVRTAVFRLKKRGWLVADQRGEVKGYSLTEVATRSFSEGDNVIWHSRVPADLADGWCVVNVSVPERERERRHQLRARFSTLGFGNMGSGMWIAPARAAASARETLEQLGLTAMSATFVGRYEPGRPLAQIVHSAWDLEALNDRYRDFVATYSPVESAVREAPPSDADAFRIYLAAVDQWRKLPFRDPGLPPELLDREWRASDAGRVFERLVDRLEPAALRWARAHWT